MKPTPFEIATPAAESVPASGVPEIPLPEPMDLAKLAALFDRDDPTTAIERAMMFYLEAVLFLRQCHWKGDSLIMSYGSDARKEAIMKRCREQGFGSLWGETLELDPAKNEDATRAYLAKHGVRFKTARAVLENCRHSFPPQLLELTLFKQTRESKVSYRISKHLLDLLVNGVKARRNDSKQRSWITRRAEATKATSSEIPENKPLKKKRLSDARS